MSEYWKNGKQKTKRSHALSKRTRQKDMQRLAKLRRVPRVV